MSFISAGFFITMALTVVLYYIVPPKYQWWILLAVSLGFYATYGVYFLGYILFTSFSAYCITRIMATCADKHQRKRWMVLALVANFGILVFLKYSNFAISNINGLLSLLVHQSPIPGLSIVMPLGISFYTFQTMSYVLDIYHKKYEPETNYFKLALFTSFLPQLLQGPIGRYDRLAPQFFRGNAFDLKNIQYGAQRVLWGLAKKLILADRAAVIVNTVFGYDYIYSGAHILTALLLYSIEIYCDFSGGIDVVIGIAEMFGIQLDENFRQPYFSKSIGEFWRRWHITLGTWMKDYIFYPFSLSRKMLKFGKKARKKFGNTTGKVLPICLANLLIFFIVGVWHGADWKYILYGMYNGIIIAVSNFMKPHYAVMAGKFHIDVKTRRWKLFQIFRTFVLVNLAWFFDICSSAGGAFYAFSRMFVGFRLDVLWDGSFLKMGLNVRDWKILAVGITILFVTDVMQEKGIRLRDFVANRPIVLRWALYLFLIFCTAPFGYVGAGSEFIYAQF